MKFHWTKILLLLIILINSAVFLLYGTAKLFGLQLVYHTPPADTLFKNVSPRGIMWAFFSIKKSYVILVALAEIIPAILILFRATRLLGCLLYLFAVTNILAINIFFGITHETLFISVVLFINIIIILFSERQKLRTLLN